MGSSRADADCATVRELVDSKARYGRERLVAALDAWSDDPPADARAQLAYLVQREATRISDCLRLLPARPVPFGRAADVVRAHCLPVTGLLDTETVAEHARSHIDALRDLAAERGAGLPQEPDPDADLARAERRVPQQTFATFADLPGGDGLTPAATADLARALGHSTGWAAPQWLQCALLLASGKRSLRAIVHALRAEGCGVTTQRLITTFDALAEHGLVHYRPYLTHDDLVTALRAVGVGPGMTLVVHSGLSRFGHVEGGAETVIAALDAVLGPEGNLCMPTHSLSWLGQRPYDPATSRSKVGAVSEVFRRQTGVLRSAHPTHSVAVRGPLAAELVAGHDASCAPLGEDGFWGHLVAAGGWVLMLAPLRSCTLLHAGELAAGIPAPAVQVPLAAGRDAPTATIPAMPWHVDWFDRAFERLGTDGSEVPLGEASIHLFPAAALREAATAVLTEDPEAVAPAGCPCPWCAARSSPDPATKTRSS